MDEYTAKRIARIEAKIDAFGGIGVAALIVFGGPYFSGLISRQYGWSHTWSDIAAYAGIVVLISIIARHAYRD